jgi:hypothetical protein
MSAIARIAENCPLGVIRRARGPFAAGCLGAFLVGMVLDASALGQAERAAMSAAEISKLIAELDHDEYRVRQDATKKLANGGVQAVAPLAKVAVGENLESAFRALTALKELGCALDPATEEAAFTAIESLSASGSMTAERARRVLVGMRAASQQRAKERLRELGADVVENDGSNAFAGGGPIIIGGGGAVVGGRVVFLGGGESDYFFNGTSVVVGEKWTGKPEDLRLLRRIDNVAQIAFVGPKITDECLAQLKGLVSTTLQRIEVRKTKITDAGLANLAGFSSLVAIDLMHTPITDESIDMLSKLANAQQIRMYGTKISVEGAAKLSAALPNARIDRRRGAILGVRGTPGELPCVVNSVQPDSVAAKAGVLANDVIVAFDGKPIGDFTELTAAISEKMGGDKIQLDILRPAESGSADASPTKQTVTVTLGEW